MSGPCALGHFGLVGSGGQRGLSGRASRGLLHLEAKMTTSTSNRDTSNTDQLKSEKLTSFRSLVKHRLRTHKGILR